MSRFARVRALATFEVRQQVREPLTALYALVFLLLTLGFTSSGAVELVSARGAVPRTSDWSLWLAFGGLTAFGQVITTMVAVTAVLRDDAVRVTPQLVAAGVKASEWLVARLLAATLVLFAVYLAMPVGASLGAVWSAERTPEAAPSMLAAYAVLTLPSMLVVATLVGVSAALTRRVLIALAVSLLLVGLWQLSLSLETDQATRALGAWLDPFGNAPVLAETRGWSEADRVQRAVPRGGLVLQNRVIWLTIAGAALLYGLRRVRWDSGWEPWPPRRSASDAALNHVASFSAPAPASIASESLTRVPVRDLRRVITNGSAVARSTTSASIASFTAGWIRRDGGWRVVAGLAAANALLSAWFRSDPMAAYGNTTLGLVALFDLVREHSRVFLILLATVYAGELVWRDREARVGELLDTMPVSTLVMALGRLLGLLRAQWVVVGWLSAGAMLVALAQGLMGSRAEVALWLLWSLAHLWAPFLQWTVLALAIHVVIRHKVGAHLALITGWVVAVVLDRAGAAGWWYRYAEPAPLMEGSGLAWTSVLQRGAYWMFVALVLLPVIVKYWPRGTTSRR